jgi:hypothetical protein
MKKIIFILLFSIIATISFAQASAASARMFKDIKAWQQREQFRTDLFFNYTLDTSELYALIRLSKDFAGHTNWEYSTSNISNTFASLFPVLGKGNNNVTRANYLFYQTNTRYSGHSLNLVGSPTISNNSIVFNGTTQYGIIQYFRDWSSNNQSMTPRFLMDSILAISPTDTLAQTNMNLSIFMKDTSDRMRFGASNAPSAGDFRLLNTAGTTFSTLLYNTTTGALGGSISSSEGLYSTSRNGLTDSIFLRGSLVAAQTNGSYNFGLARDVTNPFFVQSFSAGVALVAGTVQYLAILRRGLNATEQLAYYNAVREFIRRKTQ